MNSTIVILVSNHESSSTDDDNDEPTIIADWDTDDEKDIEDKNAETTDDITCHFGRKSLRSTHFAKTNRNNPLFVSVNGSSSVLEVGPPAAQVPLRREFYLPFRETTE